MIKYKWWEYQIKEHLLKARQWYKFIRKNRCPVCKSKDIELISRIQKKGFIVVRKKCKCGYRYKYIVDDSK